MIGEISEVQDRGLEDDLWDFLLAIRNSVGFTHNVVELIVDATRVASRPLLKRSMYFLFTVSGIRAPI